jgi:hypothetical protein
VGLVPTDQNDLNYAELSTEGQNIFELTDNAQITERDPLNAKILKAYALNEATDLIQDAAIAFIVDFLEKSKPMERRHFMDIRSNRKRKRFEVVLDYVGYVVIDTHIPEGENCCVGGSMMLKTAQEICDDLNAEHDKIQKEKNEGSK